jgi:hypothetical protein
VPGDVDAGLRKWAEQSKFGQKPTVETPTEIEGEWLGPCFPVSTTFNGKVAQSANVGFIFRGNSFYRQVDYFPEPDCRYKGPGTLGQNRVGGDLAAGWFVLRNGPGGVKRIDLLAAPNFGNVWMMNVYRVEGSASAKVLVMGDVGLNDQRRPAIPTVKYGRWDTATYALKSR